MARRTNQLNVDRLEARDLMAGNLSAVVTNGILQVREGLLSANTDNGVSITQLSNGKYRVIGIPSADGSPTKINGADFKDFFVPSAKVNVRLGAGNDLITVFGGRYNTLSLVVGAPNVADADQVIIGGVKTTGGVHIATGGGVDKVSVQNSTIGDGIGTTDNLNVFTGAGADTVEIGSHTNGFMDIAGNLRVATFSSVTEPDNDSISVLSSHVGSLVALDLGAGDDTLKIENSTAADIVALTGTGNDKATLTEVTADDQFFVDMSHGNDRMDIVFLRARDLALHGGLGIDRLTTFLDGPTGTRTLTGWEAINQPLPPIVFESVVGGGGVLTLA